MFPALASLRTCAVCRRAYAVIPTLGNSMATTTASQNLLVNADCPIPRARILTYARSSRRKKEPCFAFLDGRLIIRVCGLLESSSRGDGQRHDQGVGDMHGPCIASLASFAEAVKPSSHPASSPAQHWCMSSGANPYSNRAGGMTARRPYSRGTLRNSSNSRGRSTAEASPSCTTTR